MDQNETNESKEKGDGSEPSRLGKMGEVVYNMTKGVISKAVQFIKPSTTTTTTTPTTTTTTTTNQHTHTANECTEENTNHTNATTSTRLAIVLFLK